MTTSTRHTALMQKTKAALADQVLALRHRVEELEAIPADKNTAEAGKNRVEQQLRHAVEMLPHPVIIYDLNDHLVFFNRAYSDFFSYMPPFEEIAGKHFLDVIQYSIDVPGVVVDPLLQADPQAYRAKRLDRLHNPPRGTFEQFTSGRWHLVSEHRIADLGFFSIRQDITDRVEDKQVLAAAKDEAESANRAKSAFLAAMSHEIRTPMNGVIGMVELLRETILDVEQFRMTNAIGESAFSLLEIIDNILDFSKIEAGKVEMDNISFSILDLVEGVATNLHPNALKKLIRLRIYIDPEIPEWVIGDPGRVRQILFNLAGNAIKFIENKSDSLDVVLLRAQRIASDGSQDHQVMVRFSVQDTGIGIDKDSLTGLFEPFTQAERSTTRRFGGSGLGLSISRNLAAMMNGDIFVESELGEGSTFSVDLPFEIDLETAPRGDETDLSGLRALMVMSKDDASDIGTPYLENKGCVVTHGDDLEAVEKTIMQATQDGPSINIVIIGSTWPIDAQERLINSIRENPALEGVRFVVLTGDPIARRGMIEPDMVVVSDFPLRRTAFLFGVAMVAGRASPKLLKDVERLTKNVSIAPTFEEAAAAGRLILIAEDNDINQKLFHMQLIKLGYAAEVVGDGKKALKAWQEGNYALVLTDCHMPEMDGYALSAAIRESEAGSPNHIPIIAITANVLQGEVQRCLAAGMDDFLPKPVELEKLEQMLLKWMPDTAGLEAEVAAVDLAVLSKFVGDDAAMHRVFHGKFIDSTKQMEEQIQVAYDTRSAIVIGDLAHKLKSSARSIGANALADTCQELESAVAKDDWKTIDKLAPKIGNLVKNVKNFISKY